MSSTSVRLRPRTPVLIEARFSRPEVAPSRKDPRERIPALAAAGAIVLLPLLVPIGSGMVAVDVFLVIAIAVTLLWIGAGVRLQLPYVIPVALIIVGGAIGTIRSPVPILSSLTLLQDIYLLLWAACVANVMRTPGSVRTIVRAWCVAGSLWAFALIVGIGVVGSSVLTSTTGRASFAFGDDNGLALYFVVTLMLVIGTRRPERPMARAAAIAVLLVATVLTGSLAGLTGLVAGSMLVVVVAIALRAGLAVAIPVAIVGFLAIGLFWVNADSLALSADRSSYSILRNSVGREAQSKGSRRVLSEETWRLFRSGGIFGQGPAATKTLLLESQAAYVKEAHDDWTAALVERGIIGVLGVGLLVAAFGRRAIAIVDPSRLKPAFRAAIPRPAVVLGALVTILVYSVTHEVLHDRTAWTLLGFTAGLFHWAREETSEVEG